MARRGHAARYLPIFAVMLLSLFAHDVRADSAQDYNRLLTQFDALMDDGRYELAEQTALRLRGLAQGPLSGQSRALMAQALNSLGNVYHETGRYLESEACYRQSVDIWRVVFHSNHPAVAQGLNNLALSYAFQGRYREAEPLFKQALEIRSRSSGGMDRRVADSLNCLGNLCQEQGRLVEAANHHHAAYAIRQALFKEPHPLLADSLNNLANVYLSQLRTASAGALHTAALAMRRKCLRPGHPAIATSLNNLALAYYKQGRLADAEPLCRQALDIRRAAFGERHIRVATSLNNLARIYVALERYSDAEPLLEKALEILEERVGDQHPRFAESVSELASLYCRWGRGTEAKPLLARLEKLVESGVCSPGQKASIHWNRARLARSAGDHKQVDELLDLAWTEMEGQRAHVPGGELDAAIFLAGWFDLLEYTVSWKLETGTSAEIFEVIERGRVRGFLDQMRISGVDGLAGVPREQAAIYRREEENAGTRIRLLESQLATVHQKYHSEQLRRRETTRLLAELEQARRQYAVAYAAIRQASPAYRQAVGENRKFASLGELHNWAKDKHTLVLEYLLGAEGGYVLVVRPDDEPRVEELSITKEQAELLRLDAGPLTAPQMISVSQNEKDTGILQQIRKPGDSQANDSLHATLALLWQVLIPEKERTSILSGEYDRILVIPDPTLAAIPFETLVVENGDDVRYLLDAGPPIHYAPSATVLLDLLKRGHRDRESWKALTVGDCRNSRAVLAHSAWETNWLADVFGKKGVQTVTLTADRATEAIVRDNLAGRQIIHFACHGLLDLSHGNLFGALALTSPTTSDDPSDDGYLRLAEIYELSLPDCELAILSACDTNAGPDQPGEGVWALSRGFLVAGCRRAIASNWLVDDKATASLISYFGSILAQDIEHGGELNIANALWQTKRWLRNEEKWSHPYYWAPFVLMGPN